MNGSPKRRPQLLQLEDRLTPSFGPVGAEFHVNTYATGGVSVQRVASDADGNFVVVWQSEGQPGGNDTDIYAQRFSDDGAPLGGEFRVNSNTAGLQAVPAVAMNATGDFVVVWHGGSASQVRVFAQRFSAAGAMLGSEFLVSAFNTFSNGFPVVAMDADGGFVVVWDKSDLNSADVAARRYSASGSSLGGEFRVNTHTTGYQGSSRVAMAADGNFVVVWSSSDQLGFAFGDIYAQRYNADGASLGGEVRVDTFTGNGQGRPKTAMDADGDFVVAWESSGQDGSGSGVYGQRFSAAGTASGGEFQINTYTDMSQTFSEVAMDADGDFVVVWHSPAQDGSGDGVYAQRFSSDGTPSGIEFRVNTYTTSTQYRPAVTSDADGDLVVTWRSDQEGPVGGIGIYAQRYHANRPPTTSGLPSATIPLAPSTSIDLAPGFADADDGLAGLTFSVTSNTNPALFTSTTISGSSLTLTPAGAIGSATLTIRATDPDGDFVETSFTVTVGAVAPIVSGTQINSGAQQRSRVTSLTVTFSAQVTFAGPVANAFIVSRTGGGSVAFAATANVFNGVTVVTLDSFTGPESQSGSLRDGNYTLAALASQISAGGQQMAANYEFSLFRFYGDMNGDRRVDISDFGFFSLAFLQTANYNAALDFNGDGRIDISDFGQFSARYFATLP